MKIKCDYCGQMVEESLPSCPNCGAALSGVNRMASEQPHTIEQLKEWYVSHHLPPENVTRFFIGKDIKEPKAFGIYKDSNGDFVVYKNKESGQRVIRYSGSDEEYAVNELYQRLRGEIVDQKKRSVEANISRNRNVNSHSYRSYNANSNVGKSKGRGKRRRFRSLRIWAILLVIVSMAYALLDDTPAKGYYRYDGRDYYFQQDKWYAYDDVNDTWDLYEDSSLGDVITDETSREYRIYNHEGSRFEDTTWYDPGTYSTSSWKSDDSSYDSWDSSDSWDSYDSWDSSDSWDYGSSDWDSDW